jgi:hypothetical protein
MLYLHSILTDKGRALLEKHLQKPFQPYQTPVVPS